jgi:hypothetical protein
MLIDKVHPIKFPYFLSEHALPGTPEIQYSTVLRRNFSNVNKWEIYVP